MGTPTQRDKNATPQAGARGAARVVSLRGLSMISVLAFAVLSIGDALLVVSTADLVRSSLRDVERDWQKVESVQTFERELREYQLLGNLWMVSQDVAVAGTLAAADADLRRAGEEMDRAVERPHERGLLAEVQRATTALREARREAVSAPAPRATAEVAERFDEVVDKLVALRTVYEDKRRASRAAARRALELQTTASFASAALILCGLIAASIVLRRFVLRPIFRLQAGVNQYRPGDGVTQIDGGPVEETRELAERFNELTATIDRQRADQLTYLASIAHDIRNPLSALRSFAALAGDGEETAALRARFERQVDRLNRMVSDLLDATRIEAGHLELRLEMADLRDVVRSVVDLYRPTVTTHKIHVDCPAEALVVRGDSLRLDQVVSNLLTNAVKYSPEGSHVNVRLRRSDEAATIEVADEGMGIESAELPHVFAPFRRVSGSKTRVAGVGLGLSICRRIVEAHGGAIRVESELGVGSTFIVELPLVRERGASAP